MVADFMPLYTLHLQVDRAGADESGCDRSVSSWSLQGWSKRSARRHRPDSEHLPASRNRGERCIAASANRLPVSRRCPGTRRLGNRPPPVQPSPLICKLYGRMPQKVVVLGAGAIGSLVGARLHEAGADVRLIGRQDHVDAIRANGLLLKDEGKTWRVRVPATTMLPYDADIIV